MTLTSTGGTIGGLTDANTATPGIQLVGSAAAINQALLGATFTAAQAGAPAIQLSVSDGSSPPVIQTVVFAAQAANPNVPSYIMESQAPGINQPGVPAVLGDGNADGIADNRQDAVSSGLFAFTNPPPGSAESGYLTLVAGGVQGKVDAANPNPASVTVFKSADAPADAPAELPALLNLPFGLLSLAVAVSQAGATERFSLYLDPNLGVNGFWTPDGSSGTWVNLASAPYGGRVVMEGDRLRLDFEITDGGALDADGQADGVITQTAAPGFLPLSIVGQAPVLAQGEFWF